MHTIKVHDKTFTTYLSEQELQSRVKELAGYINRDFEGKKVVFIAILNHYCPTK